MLCRQQRQWPHRQSTLPPQSALRQCSTRTLHRLRAMQPRPPRRVATIMGPRTPAERLCAQPPSGAERPWLVCCGMQVSSKQNTIMDGSGQARSKQSQRPPFMDEQIQRQGNKTGRLGNKSALAGKCWDSREKDAGLERKFSVSIMLPSLQAPTKFGCKFAFVTFEDLKYVVFKTRQILHIKLSSREM